MADGSTADEIDVSVILVGRPVALEIVKEGGPVGQQVMHLEIAQREGESVVDADQRRNILGQALGDHSAMPRRVQYLRGEGGGGTSVGVASPSAR